MERNVNFVLIGSIFCVLLVAMIAFIFWVGRLGIDDRRVRIYHVYTQDNVAAIGTNTAIKYKGITIGNVVGLGFKSGEVGTVQIDVAINKKIPIKKGSGLIIDSDGFVGMSYLNLRQNDSGDIIKDGDEPLLLLERNSISKILDNAEGMSKDLQEIMTNVKVLTDSQTTKELIETINSFKSTKENLDETLISANKLIKDLDRAVLNGDFNYKELMVPLSQRAQNSLVILNTFLEKASHFMDRLERDPYETLLGKRN